MASGSYAHKRDPQLPLEEEIAKQIPPRATRNLVVTQDSMPDDSDNAPEMVPIAAPRRPSEHAARSRVVQELPLPLRPQVAAISPSRRLAMHVRKPSGPWLKPWVLSLIGVTCFLGILLSAGILQRPSSHYIYNQGGQAYDIQVGGDKANSWQHPMDPQTEILPQSGPYSVLGNPSITADFINQVLAAYKSPAAGKGQALHDLGVQYEIDPAFALAFFMHESTFGNKGEATKSLSLGNLRCIPNFRCEDNFAQFNTWEDGFKAWYQLIRNLYVAQWKLTTVDQIIPKYAPSADNNNEQGYIAALKRAIDTWHAGQIIVK